MRQKLKLVCKLSEYPRQGGPNYFINEVSGKRYYNCPALLKWFCTTVTFRLVLPVKSVIESNAAQIVEFSFTSCQILPFVVGVDGRPVALFRLSVSWVGDNN